VGGEGTNGISAKGRKKTEEEVGKVSRTYTFKEILCQLRMSERRIDNPFK